MRGPGLPTSDEKEDSFEDQIIIKMCEGDKTKPERRQSVAGRRKTGRADMRRSCVQSRVWLCY